MTNKIILAGNPNTGKTTLFNSITHKNYHVGNWHGITVQTAEEQFKFGKTVGQIADLPGLYSLNFHSAEEKVAHDYLQNNKDAVVVCVLDANNLKRNMLLALELAEQNYNLVLAVNMANEMPQLDFDALEKLLGIKVFAIDARNPKSVKNFLSSLLKISNFGHAKLPYLFRLANNLQDCALTRYQYIDKVLSQICYPSKVYGTSRLDKLFYNKYLALPIFLLVMLAVFAITFGAIGQNFSIIVSSLFEKFADLINSALVKLNISAWAHSLISNGVVAGIGVVVSFIPQIVLLNLCINFLEDIGYFSRVAFMFDSFFKKIGLSGKSIMSIFLGYGCSASAMLTTRALDDINLRKRTALVLPFASCNAKMPIYLVVCSAFFSSHKVLVVFLMYLFSILIGLFVSFVASRIKPQKTSVLMMEMPPIRVQRFSKTIKNAASSTIDFVKRVGSTIVLCSIFIWVLSNISFGFEYCTNIEHSILYSVSRIISPVLAPIGLNNWAIVVALVVGLSAKEMIVSCLAISNGVVGSLPLLAASLTNPASPAHLTVASAISFLVFVLLYTPCYSTIAVASKEIGKKFAANMFFFQFAVAYTFAFVAYRFSSMIVAGKIIELVIVLFVLALCISLVLIYIHKSKKKKCASCKGNFCGKNCLSKTDQTNRFFERKV